MEVYRRSSWLLLVLGLTLLATALQGVQGEVEPDGPTESECRPYIEKALKELEAGEADDIPPTETGDSKEDIPTVEITTDDSDQPEDDGDNDGDENVQTDIPEEEEEIIYHAEEDNNISSAEDDIERADEHDHDEGNDDKTNEEDDDSSEEQIVHEEMIRETIALAQTAVEFPEEQSEENLPVDPQIEDTDTTTEETEVSSKENGEEEHQQSGEDVDASKEADVDDSEVENLITSAEQTPESNEDEGSKHEESQENEEFSSHEEAGEEEHAEGSQENSEETVERSQEGAGEISTEADIVASKEEDITYSKEETQTENRESYDSQDSKEEKIEYIGKEDGHISVLVKRSIPDNTDIDKEDEDQPETDAGKEKGEVVEGGDLIVEEMPVVEELIKESEEDLTELRPREHIAQLLKLDDESSETEKVTDRTSEIILRDLKKLYENAIKPLETLYKYRDLSNRHFGDAEIFSKPLILFMGPWSGGKSSIINYLVDIEYNETSLHTGAEPSPAYFNILMHGDEPEILDGTELAADYTFSGLQKFGQGLEERLRGYKLPSKLLEKVNIVEIPGILEVRKQVSRIFPFNDACQWFIDRADIIFLIYDPSKLDVGPETEAILDQLKGREHQTRIVLNKADQVKPEELMRVQGALIWNISPLMSSAQPPVMYTTSLWSRPYEVWAPVRLLQAQERALLRDLRSAVDKRIENKIASARRFAVRVRNHAKMVDCYLTTYYNHKSVFGNRKQISDEIINHPQDYHIYEGLSTLTNISRYDLPDPDVYKDFFRLNALYDFQQLSATCTYFRGCPINRLDVAIAYDLPELVGKHKRLIETALNEPNTTPTPGS